MTPHVVEQLPDLLVAGLPARERDAVQAHVDVCAGCADALADLKEIYALLALTLAPEAPSPAVRARLLASTTPGRLHRFAGQVAALFAIGEADARAALDGIDETEGWAPSFLPGSVHRLVTAGESALGFFIRVPAGVHVPWHQHCGTERTLVLQGELVDPQGRAWLPGEQMPMETGSRHTFRAGDGEDLVCGVYMENGVFVVDGPED